MWRTKRRRRRHLDGPAVVIEALGQPDGTAAVRRLTAALGGDPVVVRERLVGEPAIRSRRLLFGSGGEVVLQDDVVAAVLLHLVPTSAAPVGIDLSQWIPQLDNAATLDAVGKATGIQPRHATSYEWSLPLERGHARFQFAGSWQEPGNLARVAFSLAKPGTQCRPEDDDCPACSDLLVRAEGSGGAEVDATIEALSAAVTTGELRESAAWVPLADLRPLHASGLMERVEAQLSCRSCGRVLCFTLHRNSSPTLVHRGFDEARRRPLEAIPPVEQWGDVARVAAARDGLRYLDHERGSWFLLGQGDDLYLDARYSYSALIDDSALIRLDESEVAEYRAGGHDYLTRLAERIHNSAPYTSESPYHDRDLHQRPDGPTRDEVSAAIVNHTWLAEQRNPHG